MGRIDGERREHREDPSLEDLRQLLALLHRELRPVDDLDAGPPQRRHQLPDVEVVLRLDELVDPIADLDELLSGSSPVG
jgi:hypothetical protein